MHGLLHDGFVIKDLTSSTPQSLVRPPIRSAMSGGSHHLAYSGYIAYTLL